VLLGDFASQSTARGPDYLRYRRIMADSRVVAAAVVVGALFGAILLRTRPSTDPRCTAFAQHFGIQDLVGQSGYLAGTLRGLSVEMRYYPARKQSPARTVTTVAGIPATMLLHLRPQTDEEVEQVRKGDALDLDLGNPAFDAAWIVEGAPAARVERVLRHPWFFDRFMALAIQDRPSVLIEDGKVIIDVIGNDFEGPTINSERFVLAMALAEAVALDAATPLPATAEALAATYRTSARQDPDDAGRLRLAELRVLRGTRAIAALRPVGLVFPALITALLLALCFIPDSPVFILLPVSFVLTVPSTAFVVGSSISIVRKAPGTRFDKPVLVSLAVSWAVNVGMVVWLLRGGGAR